MIIRGVEQGSDEWFQLRAGMPTASNFDRIITPKTLKPSGQSGKYMDALVAEILTGEVGTSENSPFMSRGTGMEGEARSWYEFDTGSPVEQVAFVTCDEEGIEAGGSPDGLIDGGLIEIKCRGAGEHVGVMRSEKHGATDTQVQGLLWLLGPSYGFCDVIHYNPTLKPVVRRVERNEDYIGALRAAVLGFCNELKDTVEALRG